MVFKNLFESRNKTVGKLIKLGDALGRSLRENVHIFNIDSDDQTVCYVTESNKVITGTYSFGKGIKLNKIKIENLELFENNKKFDSFLSAKISSFIGGIYEDKYTKATDNFVDILSLWEDRAKFVNINKKLQNKRDNFSDNTSIVETKEFQQFLEIAPELVKFLKENRIKISKVTEIKNAVNLAKTVSEAFNCPRLEYEDLAEKVEYVVEENINSSIYETICKQELIKKEILENKANFDTVWATNEKIQNLAGLIYSDRAEIEQALTEAIVEVPYLALASKKQLTETFQNCLSINDATQVSLPEIQRYSSYIFELKKEVRKTLITTLNEKYGVNILNLKEPPSFKSLLNTQVVVFESLAKLSPKNSVQRQTLSNVAEMLKSKNGVEAIDVTDVLNEIFQVAKYTEFMNESSMSRYLDFERIANDLGEVSNVLKLIKQMSGQMNNPLNQPAQQMGNDPMAGGMPNQGAGMAGPGMGMQKPAGAPAPGMGSPAKSLGADNDDVSMPMGNNNLGPEGEEEGMQDPAAQMGGGDPLEEPATDMSKDSLMSTIAELEQLLSTLKVDMGAGDDEMPQDDFGGQNAMDGEDMEGMEDEGGGFPEEEEEGEEDFDGDDEVNVDTGDGDDDVHIDVVDGEHDMDSDDEEEGETEEQAPKKKGKGFPPKGGKSKPKGKGFPPKK